MIKLVVFDLDETLLNPVEMYKIYVALRTATIAARLGISLDKAREKVAGLKRELPIGTTEAVFDALGIGKEVWREKMLEVDPRKFVEPDPSVKGVLDSINVSKVLLTGLPVEQMLEELEAAGILDSFDLLVGWEKGGEPPKHSSKTWESIFARFGVRPQEVVAVGNEVSTDLPKELGVWTVLVGNDPFADADTIRKKVDIQIDSILKLPAVVEKIGQMQEQQHAESIEPSFGRAKGVQPNLLNLRRGNGTIPQPSKLKE